MRSLKTNGTFPGLVPLARCYQPSPERFNILSIGQDTRTALVDILNKEYLVPDTIEQPYTRPVESSVYFKTLSPVRTVGFLLILALDNTPSIICDRLIEFRGLYCSLRTLDRSSVQDDGLYHEVLTLSDSMTARPVDYSEHPSLKWLCANVHRGLVICPKALTSSGSAPGLANRPCVACIITLLVLRCYAN